MDSEIAFEDGVYLCEICDGVTGVPVRFVISSRLLLITKFGRPGE